jgi:hypothetical protein
MQFIATMHHTIISDVTDKNKNKYLIQSKEKKTKYIPFRERAEAPLQWPRPLTLCLMLHNHFGAKYASLKLSTTTLTSTTFSRVPSFTKHTSLLPA